MTINSIVTFFLIKIFQEIFLILHFNGAPTTNPSIYNYYPHLRGKFRFAIPRAIVFLMVCPRCQNMFWVDRSEYLPQTWA